MLWEDRIYILVEDRNAAQRSTGPLGKISIELGINRLEKWAHERDLECWPSDRAFLLDVHDYKVSAMQQRLSPAILHLGYLGLKSPVPARMSPSIAKSTSSR